MEKISLTEQQRKIALQRLLGALTNVSKGSARVLIYVAMIGAIVSLSPEASEQLLNASPLLASFVGSISGDLMAGLLEKIASKDEPTPEEIVQLLEELLSQAQGMTKQLENLPSRREFVEVIQGLHDKQAVQFSNLDHQGDLILASLEKILRKIESLAVETKLEPVDESEAEARYLQWVQKEYNSVQILGMTKPMALGGVYTEVYWLYKGKYEASKEYQQEQFLARRQEPTDERHKGVELLENKKLIFIEGKPGAGKTTFMRHLALQAAREELAITKIPVYIELKRLNISTETLFDLIVNEFTHANFSNAQTYATQLLNAGKALILLDGLDEVIPEKREAVNEQIIALRKLCDDKHLLLTCRPHGEKRTFEKFIYVEMADFLPKQVKKFVHNWFGDAIDTIDGLLEELDKPVHKTIQELTRTPLLLALLCIAYADKPRFPKKRHELYERAIKVVLAQWDDTRGIKRESTYGQLTQKRKEQLLAYIGFHTFEAKKYFFPQYTLEKHINAVTHMFRQKDIKHQKEEFGGVILEPERLFPADTDPEAIIIEIAVQHGLFVTQANDSFSFSHLTFQEYFAARYLVANTPQGTLEQLLNHIDDTQWREVFLLTAGLLEETDAEHFFDQFIARLDKMVVNTKLIQGILQWAMEKPMAHESPALRAWYHSLALDYAHDLAYDYSRADDRLPYFPRYEVRTIARSLARDLELEKFHSLTEIDYKSVVWNETSEKIYAAYVRGTALLVECLALATVFDRKAIEARLLCPASEDGIE